MQRMIRACHKVFFGQASVLVQDMGKKKKEAGSYREEILLEEAYKHSYPQDGYSICLRITTDGQWWEDGILKGELTRTGLETEGISV